MTRYLVPLRMTRYHILLPMTRYIIPLLVIATAISCKSKTNFEEISSAHSGITFNNAITDSDSINVLSVENIYNGGGVGIGDFNNDGLADIYFTGNMVPNKLYLNTGGMKFRDVTEAANVHGGGRWCRGVSVVDINNDGLTDIYVSASLSDNVERRRNLLYINKGLNADKVPVFEDMSSGYGLDDTTHSTMAAFFDYDNDGDLDMYLLVNEIVKHESPNNFRPQLRNREHRNTDKLFRNDWDETLKHPVFTDVSKEAGVNIEGYGHGVNIVDINKDGWKDVYVTNDFLSLNLLYINQKDGTFKNEVDAYFKHTAENAMGNDVIDINNDGLADVIELDMNPEDNYRKKMMMNSIGYQRYTNNDYYGYQYQYVRNVLQVNQGRKVMENDSLGHPVFSDISFYAGIAETDWSWSPTVADFDNDGMRDIIVTNGFPKDVTDHDFMAFRNKASGLSSQKEILDQIPQVKIANYAYRNNGNLSFSNVTKDWGMQKASFSNGAAYADLDNDGDLDLIINNIDDAATVYQNNFRKSQPENSNYLAVKFVGNKTNLNGLGAWVEIYDRKADGSYSQQVYENSPYRGYLSSVINYAHFGLGDIADVDSIVVKWPGGKMQTLLNQKANQTIVAEEKNAVEVFDFESQTATASQAVFKEITRQAGINFVHEDKDFVDFNIQNLLPHKLSQYGPALAAGDIDGNGLDDIISGGSYFYPAEIFLQQPGGKFTQRKLLPREDSAGKAAEDMGILLFDADGDKDLDLFIARGGYEAASGSTSYQDAFYQNDGKGNFTALNGAVPENLTSKSCVRAADFDRDGDLDIFVAGRVEPGKYPVPVTSFLYRNDSKDGNPKFTDITKSVAPDMLQMGLVCDALFTDFDNDGWQDLILMGEWMRVTLLKNNKGVYEDVSANSGIGNLYGWWNSVASGDFDNDGDVDYILGNFGTNSLYKPESRYPVSVIAKDFDNNGSFDAITSYFLPQSFTDPEKREVPVHLRDDMIKQIVKTRARFHTYKDYAGATMKNLLAPEQLDSAFSYRVTDLNSYYLQNDGSGKFTAKALPAAAQISVLNGIVVDDFDGDGNLDLIAAGNDFGTELTMGRYDALNGIFLKGDGKGNFNALSISESGIYLPGNMKSLVKLKGENNRYLLAAGENRGPLRLLELKAKQHQVVVTDNDVSARIQLKNGAWRKQELPYGSSFLSQSARFILAPPGTKTLEITDNKGNKRIISLP